MFNTPILFLIFNRPDVTTTVFEQIQKIKPKYLFIAADGPRKHIEGEEQICAQTRAVIQKIDWNCELKTLFRDDNLGCAKGVSSAIDWFFEHVEKGIILEDDCYPDLTFFSFCEEMLNYYNNDNQIMAISGFNAQLGIERTKDSYFFAKIPLVWGWASWRKAWHKFEFNIDKLDDTVFNTPSKLLWRREIEATYKGKMDSWAFRWIYSFFKNDFTCIYPNVSLIKNIGVDKNATHTSAERWWYKSIKYGQITTIHHPSKVEISEKADVLTTNLHMNVPLTLEDRIRRIVNKIIAR